MSDTFSCTALMQRASNSKLSWIWISGLIFPPFSYPFLIDILNHRGLFWFGQVFGVEIIEITYGHSLSLTGDDLTLWFDRKICRDIFHFTEADSGPKKLIKWQNFITTRCDLTKKLLPTIFVRAHKSSNWSGGQTHGWIFLKKEFHFISFFSIFEG